MIHDVFITYSSHDKSVAETVCAALESKHIRCWIAPRDVLPGTEWAEAIVDAIDESRVVVLVLSSSSNSSPQVIREVGRAASKGIPIIPLRIDDVSLSKAMEFFVSSHHWLDAQTRPLSKHMQRLTDTVQQLLAQEHEPKKVIEIPEEEPAVPTKKPAQAIKAVTKPNIWFWSGVVLLSLGLGSLTVVTMLILDIKQGTGELFVGMAIFVLPFAIPGVYCLRRGIAKELQTRPAEGTIPKWWWLLPIVLAFIGGIVSWVKQKDVNWRKAMNMLTLGIITTLIWTVPLFTLYTMGTPPPPTPTPTPTTAPPPTPAPLPAPGIPVTLKYETMLPGTNKMVMADTWFFNEVARLSGGLIEMEYNHEVPHSATMSPLLGAVGDGDVDCGLIPIAAIPNLIPLSQGLTLHYLTSKPDTLALAAGDVYDEFALLREEWEINNNAKVLYFLPLDTVALCTASPVPSVADLEGLTITGSSFVADTLQRLGAEQVMVPSSEIFTGLQQGKLNGSFYILEAISSLGLFEVAKCLTEPWAGPYSLYATVINKDVWDSLPADVKSPMEELGDDTLEYYIGLIMEANREAVEQMATAGIDVCIWSQSERDAAKNRVQPAQVQTWIEEVGTSGQDLITLLQDKLSLYELQSTYKSGFAIWEEEYGPPSPKLLYEDDFSDPSSGWPTPSSEVYEGYYEDGEYHILAKESCAAWIWRGVGPFTDFALEVDARQISGPDQGGYGLVFRFKDSENFYRFLVSEDSYYLVGTRTNGTWIRLQSKTKSAFIKEGTNHLKVVCQGSQLEVYVNGHHLTTITDNSFTGGNVGMIMDTPEANTRVAFDNIRVYSLD